MALLPATPTTPWPPSPSIPKSPSTSIMEPTSDGLGILCDFDCCSIISLSFLRSVDLAYNACAGWPLSVVGLKTQRQL
jgi:hypothetical protein